MSVTPIYATRNNRQFISFSGEAMNKATAISSLVLGNFQSHKWDVTSAGIVLRGELHTKNLCLCKAGTGVL